MPEDVYRALYVIGGAEWRSEDLVVLEGAAGESRVARLGLSGWWPRSRAGFGNRAAFRFSRLHYPRHIQRNMAPQLWLASLRFRPLRVRHLRLPDNPALHLFAITLGTHRSNRRFERGLRPRNPVLGEASEGAIAAPSDVLPRGRS